MRGVQISYLIEHPEYIPQLAQWLFEKWGHILDEKNTETRMKKLKTHMNRDELPMTWVAHANGQLFGTAALRPYDHEGHEDLTPWLGGVFGRLGLSSPRNWCRIMFHGRGRGSVARDTDAVFVHARQAGVVFTPRLDSTSPVCLEPAGR